MVEGGDAQHQVHVSLEHGGGGGKQLTRTYQRRKVRRKDGVSRYGLLQLDMCNFTQHTARNSEGGRAVRTIIRVHLGQISLESDTKRRGPDQLLGISTVH